MIRALGLGQSGFVLETGGVRLVIDPYLSDSVAEEFGEHLRRQIPIVRAPGELHGVDWILLTHAHLDHTDPATLVPLASASPGAKFIGPAESRAILAVCGLADREMLPPPEGAWIDLAPGVRLRAVPAAHVALERDADGAPRYVGYLLESGGVTIYHAGDTLPHAEIFAALAGERIDYALLPVNERNFYRDREGIVGNLTVREAFQMAIDVGARTLVPIHWDLFAPNRTHPGEIRLLHELEAPPFRLEFLAAGAENVLSRQPD
ncbi:MAG: MBL fold metallo-hydrolase [Terrimicrobiaceae bacterium]|nr:MBL fold metallo-hydrolase [Terrimicrobiaceae bacterium]